MKINKRKVKGQAPAYVFRNKNFRSIERAERNIANLLELGYTIVKDTGKRVILKHL